MSSTRVRFAPSPTGPLHIGGVRTALYNYLFAKKNGGTFILRIEDTDQARYVEGAEQYIIDALNWCGIQPDEGVGFGGEYGPYRQSERKEIYRQYAERLVSTGNAYYAFDSAEDLEKKRIEDQSFKYDCQTRMSLLNSLTVSQEMTEDYLARNENVVIRLKTPESEIISFIDEIRGEVKFLSNELDDKVILKGDGMPTYHLANIVDDHLMKITHVIRGEEWLSSTGHHLLLYNYLGWKAPSFAHLPLILKPFGQGKLSKRDGAKFGFPVFPLEWFDKNENTTYTGFKEDGYLPESLLNFLALLGWSPKNDQEIFSLSELIDKFDIKNIVKSGARFDIEKAKWFNQQYIIKTENEKLARILMQQSDINGSNVTLEYITEVCRLMKERVQKLGEIIENGNFFFERPIRYEEDNVRKKFNISNKENYIEIANYLNGLEAPTKEELELNTKNKIQIIGMKIGEVMPVLRLAICGTMSGPDLFETILLIGIKECSERIKIGVLEFEKMNNLTSF